MAKKIQRFFSRIQNFFDGIHIPVLGISLWKMLSIYLDAIFKNPLGRQAASISWSFFLSLFPMILFFLSVLPFMPHYDKLQFYIFEVLMPKVFPSHMQSDVTGYIQSSLIPNMKSISNFTILLSFIFATNGCFSLINGFNRNTELQRTFVKEYLLAMLITICFLSFVCLSIFGIYYSEVVLKLFTPTYDISWFTQNLTKIIGFISFPLFYLILLTLFYWIGCIKITRLREAFPGAVLTTVLFVILTYFFAIYVANIARYNILYGSIGSIILVMVWVNVNVFLVLMGNELNLAIKKVKLEKLIREEMTSGAIEA
ncbi:YihY/virulence factor BrkB family protein [Epilithonimonas sp.]|uniref:YihY/virulence factor BrkB family protein n=1 Tax=Epilithonimonas sp. TaxID=2894511 RepID=UPI0028B05CCF|nr:YihY/virulence factor BrkB family protein [Epilithonimonas sp.]